MNADVRHRKLFRRKGYQVEIAENGQVGVEMAEALRPDLILMDLNMPVLDGWEATRRIKTNPTLSRIPLIVFSGNALEQDRIRALEAGADRFMNKPMDFSQLFEIVRPMIEESRALC